MIGPWTTTFLAVHPWKSNRFITCIHHCDLSQKMRAPNMAPLSNFFHHSWLCPLCFCLVIPSIHFVGSTRNIDDTWSHTPRPNVLCLTFHFAEWHLPSWRQNWRFLNIFLISDHETDNFAWLISSKSTCWPCHSSRFVSRRWLNISVCPTVNYGILESNGDIIGIYNSCKFTSTHGTSPPRGPRCGACAALNWPPCLFGAAWIVWGIWMHMGVDTDL
jgi:hypothetical protein